MFPDVDEKKLFPVLNHRYKEKVGLTPASNLKKKDDEYASAVAVGRVGHNLAFLRNDEI